MKTPIAKTSVLLSTLAALAWASVPAEANACSPEPSDGVEVQPLWEGVGIHRDGALVGTFVDYDGDPTDSTGEFTITVMHDGVEVPGTVEVIDYIGPDAGFSRSAFMVWRPDAELEVDTYLATIDIASDPFTKVESTLETTFTVIDELAGELETTPIEADDELGVSFSSGFGPRVCCGMDFGCGDGESCRHTSERDAVTLFSDVGMDLQDGRYGYARVLSGVDGNADEPSGWILPGSDTSEGWSVNFLESADSYCIAFEYVNLLDGSTTSSNVACSDHGDLVIEEREVDLVSWAENCIDEPYWEDTGEPWVPAGESESESDSDTDGPETDSGQESDTDAPGTSGTEGETVSESDGGETDGGGTDGGETDGGDGAGTDLEDPGCGCTTRGSQSGWLGFGVLGLLGLLRRRSTKAS